MPKHVPSFKHLLASPATPQNQDKQPSTRSVNDLLASSRISHQSHSEPVAGLRPGETLWTPTSALIGIPDVEGGAVHPAEVARRRELERRRARRGVAGPAPPPSWASPSADLISVGNAADGREELERKEGYQALAGPVTTAQLVQSASIFNEHQASFSGLTPTLVEFCLRTVLRYLNDDTIVTDTSSTYDAAQTDTDGWTYGALLGEQIPYLDTHLKVQLLDCHSLLPEGSPYRLTDQSIMTVLSTSPEDVSHEGTWTDVIREESGESENNALLADLDGSRLDAMSATFSTDWDQPTVSTSIRHLPLTLHPSPVSLLRRVNTLHSTSLTSLNLAYSTITDLERLVGVLPVGLRELGLCGIRVGRGEHKQQAIESWRRGLSALGRKMIVLRMLNLSESPFPIIQQYLTALLFPSSRVPSLRLLSLRGSVDTATVLSPASPGSQVGFKAVHRQESVRSDLLEVIKGRSKERYVEVIWS